MSPHTFIALQCNHDILIGHLSEAEILEHTHWFVIIFGGFSLANYYFRRHFIFDGYFVYEKRQCQMRLGEHASFMVNFH